MHFSYTPKKSNKNQYRRKNKNRLQKPKSNNATPNKSPKKEKTITKTPIFLGQGFLTKQQTQLKKFSQDFLIKMPFNHQYWVL